MTLYILQMSSYIEDDNDIIIKNELKKKYKLDTRRQDKFIHLAIYGAQLLKDKIDINSDDELYVTSGIGDVDIVEKTNTCIYENNEPLKIFDFINLLGNTTSYYVAKSLGINRKNIFQISDNFTYINTLISIYASLKNSKKNAIICNVDLKSSPDETIKRVLGISNTHRVISGVNCQKLSLKKDNAIAKIEFDINIYTKDEIDKIIKETSWHIVFGSRDVYFQQNEKEFLFETRACYEINNAIKLKQDILYIDCFEDKYKIIKLKSYK
jgi:hypothetical protein